MLGRNRLDRIINMSFKGGGWKRMECINLAQSRENWQVLAKMAVKILRSI
jgi:Fe-S cluster assembly ATPase SufC